jgi:hypothetical protein
VNKLSTLIGGVALVLFPVVAGAQQTTTKTEPTTMMAAQQNVPAAAQGTAADIEREARRLRVGIQGGVGLDPEILDVGVHAAFGPVFSPNLGFRPGLEIGVGEVTTFFGINLDVLYTLPGFSGETRWIPYVGAGPTFGLSHRGFETEEGDHVDIDTGAVTRVSDDDDRNRFDFSDTDFNGGMNFIVGMRKQSGMFFEMKATAWGVSNVRLLAGFQF